MQKNTLSPIVYWGDTKYKLESTMVAMDHRAGEEVSKMAEGETIDTAHGEAVRDYEYLLEYVDVAEKFLKKTGFDIRGKVIDIGSGTGIGASIFSNFEQVDEVYALEFSEQFVNKIMPIVFDEYPTQISKIQRVIGDFNNLEMEDSSVDIILEIDALHHSENLDFTLKECSRVLKPGGSIIAIDRAWPDSYSRKQLEEMLDKEMTDELKLKYNVPEGESFTRRDFGEHEYTIKEWEEAFIKHGFDFNVFSQKHPPGLNSILLKLPTSRFASNVASFLYKLGFRRHVMYGFNKTRRLFVCIKK